jgi:O-antigen ligase
MNRPPSRFRTPDAVLDFAGHPRFAAALALASIGTSLFAPTIRALSGWAGLIGIVSVLAALSTLVLLGRRGELEWTGILPISLLSFVAWSCASVLWSSYQWATVGGIAYQLAIALIGVTIAVTRDMIQIVRAFGDVFRVAIAASLLLEVVSGVLLDMPIEFLGIKGDLASFGPIQGVMQTRNQLGLVATIALVTFGTELMTTSVQRLTGVLSIVAASLTILLTQSPVSFSVLATLGIASIVLLGLRRLKPESRRGWQLGISIAAIVGVVVVYIFRARLVALVNGKAELNYRLGIWHQLLTLSREHNLEGWGWIGQWHPELFPFVAIRVSPERQAASALNAYVDVWFQLGIIGLVAFIALASIALARSWLLASRKRSRVFVWPALVLVAMLTTALAESSILFEYGWLILVICSVSAAQNLSWRRALSDARGTVSPLR